MNRSYVIVFIACVVLSMGSSVAQGSQFAGGTGEYDDPYQIATPKQLLSLASDPNLLDECFILVSDIDLGNHVFQEAVIGPFAGVFDGNHRCIRGLTVVEYEGQGSGLFESIAATGEVRHLILEDVLISAYSGSIYVGTIAGFNSGVISRCSVSGVIFGAMHAGGIVDANFGFMEECRSDCLISTRSGGGLVYVNKGRIKDCYAAGQVLAEDASGFASHNTYTISRCYSVCRIVSTGSESGGFLGRSSYPCKGLRSCYFLDPLGGGSPVSCQAVPLTSGQMRQLASFVGWDFKGIKGHRGADIWFMPDGGYPELSWFGKRPIPTVLGLSAEEARKRVADAGFRVGRMVYDYDHAAEYGCAITTHPFPVAPPDSSVDIVLSLGTYEWAYNPGTGDANHPYLILSEGQFDCLAYRPDLWDQCFRLAADTDMEGRVYTSALIGRSKGTGSPFNGLFDGDGHIIRNLTIRGHSADVDQPTVFGLFGETGPQARITNLGLAGVSIIGPRQLQGTSGMLCAINSGYIGRCYCVGQLRMRGQLGGLAGSNSGVIEDCYTQGDVEEMPQRDSDGLYAGLVARNASGTVRTCYSTCAVAMYDGAALVAANDGGAVEHCFWDADAIGIRIDAVGKGLSTQEMMNGTIMWSEGWRGNPNWVFDYGKDYPRLIWEGTPGSPSPAPGEGPHRR